MTRDLSSIKEIVARITFLGTAVATTAVVLGHLGKLWWVFEGLSHFYHIYTIVLLFLAIAHGVQKHYVKAGVALLAVLLSGAMTFSALLPKHSDMDAGQKPLRVMTLNTHYYSVYSEELVRTILNTHPDIISLIEINEKTYAQLQSVLAADYPYQYLRDGYKEFNVALFANREFSQPELLAPDMNSLSYEYWSRVVRTTFEFKGSRVVLYTIHPMPPYNRGYAAARRQYYELVAREAKRESLPTVVLGDFNTSPWSPLFRDLLSESGLRDSRTGRGYQGSWPSWVPSFLRIPIDHVLVSDEIVVLDRIIGDTIGSDHLPVVVDLTLEK